MCIYELIEPEVEFLIPHHDHSLLGLTSYLWFTLSLGSIHTVLYAIPLPSQVAPNSSPLYFLVPLLGTIFL